MIDYSQLPDLDGYFLEESYVLGIVAKSFEARFDMELVLTDEHPEHSSPLRSEQYCYRNGGIRLTSPEVISYVASGHRGTQDPVGPPDFGNIDTFTNEDGTYVLEGEWGRLVVPHGQIEIWLDPLRIG